MFPEHIDDDSERSASGEQTTNVRDASEEARLFSHLVSTLPKDVSQAFLLHRRDEMGFEQIAVQMGISPREVESHIAEALKAIRAGL